MARGRRGDSLASSHRADAGPLAPMPLIEIRDLRHIYNPGTPQAVVALDGISLTIERGEFVAIVGGNGSGKSTLAKHLNALLLPTSGEVRVDGLDPRDRAAVWEIRQRVGMVF